MHLNLGLLRTFGIKVRSTFERNNVNSFGIYQAICIGASGTVITK